MTDPAASAALDACYATFGIAASYTPPGGSAGDCVVIPDNSDRFIELGHGRGLTEGRVIRVRRSEVASVVKSGVFVIGAETLTVLDDPQLLDSLRLEWTCRVDLAA